MIRFIELGWRNFLSYGNNLTTLSLDFSNPTAIIGRNLDASVGGMLDGNGAGKTTILNALTYTLFDKPVSDIKKDKLINWVNEKNMETFVIFEKNGVFYKIERFRKFAKKGGDGVKIFQNTTGVFSDSDKDIAQSKLDLANDQIVEILGMPFDIFVRTVLFTPATDAFYKLPATSAKGICQRDVLEELFGYKEISIKAELLKKKIADDKKTLANLVELNTQYINEKQRLDSQIIFTQNEYTKWNVNHEDEIRKLEDKIKLQAEINFDEERMIFSGIQKTQVKIQEKNLSLKEKEMVKRSAERSKELYVIWEQKHNDEIYNFNTIIKRYSTVNFAEEIKLFDRIESLNKEKDKLNKDINYSFEERKKVEANKKKKEQEKDKLKDHKCPYCLQDFKHTFDKEVEIGREIKQFEDDLVELKEIQTAAENALANLVTESSSLKSQFLSKNDIMQKSVEFEMAKAKLEDKLKEENPNKIVELTDNIDNEITKLNEDITALIDKVSMLKGMQRLQSEKELNDLESSISSSQKILENLVKQTNPHENVLKRLQSTELPVNKNKEIEDIEDEIEHADFLYKLLTKKDSFVRKALLGKNLPFLNQRLKYHLEKSGLPHKVVFTENMTADISQFKKQIDYGNFSAGQQVRLNLATDFSFRDVLQTRHNKINLCILDEYLDSSLSPVGSMAIAKSLKTIAKDEKISLFIISHKEEITNLFPSRVEIELDNKFSNIVKSDIPFSSA